MEPGSIVGDKYRVGRPIGRGGMGVIVEATHLQLGTRVAIKILRADATDKPEVAERFLREARAAAQLKNEHICRVHDYGTLPDHSPFMVMELLEGRDLGSLVDLEGPLDPKLVAEYVIQACAGIAEAHARTLIHRDLKPGNLFLELRADGTPCIKILDFGIAKHEGSDFKLTQTQSVVGSPSYMAPEQLKSSKLVDARTDIWAIGVAMYELLTEQLPFTGDSMPELVLAITTEPPPPIFGGKIPAGLIDIVYKCMSKNPDERFQSVGELAEALLPFAELDRKALVELTAAVLAPKPHAATRAQRVVDELVAKETTLRTATGALESRASPKTRFALAVGAVVVLVGLGVSAWLLLRGDSAERGPEQGTVGVPLDAVRAVDAAADALPDAALDAPIDSAEQTTELTVPIDAATPVELKKKHPPHHTPKHSPTETDLSKSRF